MDHPWVNLPPCDEEKAVVPLSSARNLIRTKLSAAKLPLLRMGPLRFPSG